MRAFPVPHPNAGEGDKGGHYKTVFPISTPWCGREEERAGKEVKISCNLSFVLRSNEEKIT
jgi:hypothetical protein